MFLKKKNQKILSSDIKQSLINWVSGKDIFRISLDPWERIKNILVELQKRSLSEQALLLNWDKRKEQKIISTAPIKLGPIIDSRLQLSLLKKGFMKKDILFYEDFSMDKLISDQFKNNDCYSLIFSPVNIKKDYIDVLLLINYSGWTNKSKITEFISFISSVLSFALQNARLYDELKSKNEELKKLTSDMEDRIDSGTKKILEKKAQYHDLFDSINSGIIVHDIDGNIVEVNKAACQLFGVTKKKLLDEKIDLLTENTVYNKQQAYFTQVINNIDYVKPFETILKKNDNTTFYAELKSKLVSFQGQNVIQTFINDITSKKELESNLRESREKYRILIESSILGIYIVQKGSIKFSNEMFRTISGYSNNELHDIEFFDLVDAEDRSKILSHHERLEKGIKTNFRDEIRLIRKDKTRCWCELHISNIVINQKNAVFGYMIDISDRKNLELQLLETQKLKSLGTLAGGIAHDFNNLLGGILGYSSLLLSDISDDHPFYDDIQAIAETAKRGAELSNRILAFARGGKYQVAKININNIINDVVAILSHSLDKSVIIETNLEKNIWTVYGDSRQIHQAIHNICLNARDVMPEGGILTINTKNITIHKANKENISNLENGKYVKIVIRDTGYGMDKKTKLKIFEPFFTTKPQGEGTGLGMSMVYGIVKNHNGYINIESGVGKGTSVIIFLPHIKEEESKNKKIVDMSNSKSILFVDDEDIIREVSEKMLNRGGYKVLLAKNGKEAIDIFKQNQKKISLVIIDVIMPVLDGMETSKILRDINPDIDIIFTSGYGPEDRPDLLQLNGEYFIKKPFQTEMFIEKVNEILSNK
ncbi:MAG: PAS domain S-box protein [bacterium]